MAFYELRIYPLRVGAMAEAVKLYQEVGSGAVDSGSKGQHRDGGDAPGAAPIALLSARRTQDQARLRRRGALVGRSAASSVFRLRPPLTGSNKAGWRRSGLVLGVFLEGAPRRFDAGASCAKLRSNAAIRSMTGGGAAISLGLTMSPFILASISSRKASW